MSLLNPDRLRSAATGLPLSDVSEEAERNRRLCRTMPYVEPRERTYRGCTISLFWQDDHEGGEEKRYAVHHPSQAADLAQVGTLDAALRRIDSLIARGFIPEEGS